MALACPLGEVLNRLSASAHERRKRERTPAAQDAKEYFEELSKLDRCRCEITHSPDVTTSAYIARQFLPETSPCPRETPLYPLLSETVGFLNYPRVIIDHPN